MYLSCPKCSTKYRLNPEKLGDEGHEVRCTQCGYVWFQKPEDAVIDEELDALDYDLPPDTLAFEDAKLDQDDSGVTPEAASDGEGIPQSVMPQQGDFAIPDSVYDSDIVISANRFGAMTFAALFFVTILALVVFQKPLVKCWPQMHVLYSVVGIDYYVPGKGIELSNLVAEERIDGEERTMRVKATMSNMSGEELSYPPLNVVLKAESGRVLKEWPVRTDPAPFPAGGTSPVQLDLEAPPADGSTLVLSVLTE